MNGHRRPVVVLGSTSWEHRVALGDWQLARAFSRLRHDVVWVDPPSSIARRRPAGQAADYRADQRLRVVRPVALQGSRRWFLEGVQDLMYERQVQHVLRDVGADPMVLVATPTHGPLRRLRMNHQLVYWQKDRQWAQPSLPNGAWLRRRHEELLRNADLVSAVSQEIIADNERLGVKSVLIRNGVDVDHWSSAVTEPGDLSAVPRPRALFLGAWSWRVDTALVEHVARRLPNVHFVVVGKVSATPVLRPNVHFLGAKPYDALPSYAQHADVGMVPYVEATFNAASDPLKVLEYSSAGLPVVTQGVPPPRDLPHVRACRGPEEWERAVMHAIQTSLLARSSIRKAASGHDWRTRAAELLRRAASGRAGVVAPQ